MEPFHGTYKRNINALPNEKNFSALARTITMDLLNPSLTPTAEDFNDFTIKACRTSDGPNKSFVNENKRRGHLYARFSHAIVTD